MEEIVEKNRHFGGKLFVRKVGKEWTDKERLERNVERKHLRAYLRGDVKYTHSSFGYNDKGLPVYKMVNTVWV